MRKSAAILGNSFACFGTCRPRLRHVRKQILKNSRRLRTHWVYTAGELTKMLDVHRQTLRQWRSEGLAPIDTETGPWLYSGGDVRAFIRARCAKRKSKLGQDEFYCFRCKAPRRSKGGKITMHNGNGSNEESPRVVTLTGECEVCGCKVRRMGIYRRGNVHVDSNGETRD